MNNVFLIGMPGCGKTSVAQYAKRAKDCRICDTDVIIVSKYGEISKIFEKYGEEHFRKLETEVLKNLSAEQNCVISTGGGCVLREENIRLMKSDGNKIVYLRTNLCTLEKRLKNDDTRPLLQGNTAERLIKLFSERSHIYQSVADVTVDTDELTPGDIFEKIENSLNQARGNK